MNIIWPRIYPQKYWTTSIVDLKYWKSSIVWGHNTGIPVSVLLGIVSTILVFQYCLLNNTGKPVLLIYNTGIPVSVFWISGKVNNTSYQYLLVLFQYCYCVTILENTGNNTGTLFLPVSVTILVNQY